MQNRLKMKWRFISTWRKMALAFNRPSIGLPGLRFLEKDVNLKS
jgi:hypothetical protein